MCSTGCRLGNDGAAVENQPVVESTPIRENAGLVDSDSAGKRESLRSVPATRIDLPARFGRKIRGVKPGDRATIIESIRALPWDGYHQLMADIFRQEGCEVWAGDGPDADIIDLEVTRCGLRIVVDFQLRGETRIGTAPVIEMASAGQRVQADEAFLITDGDFTPEAVAIAPELGVVLIDGRSLVDLVLRFAVGDSMSRRPRSAQVA
jgi:Restriction endonuclease